VRVDDVDHVDVVEQLHTGQLGLGKQVRRQLILGHENKVRDVLRAVDHLVGLETLRVQPTHVQHQHLAQLVRRETCLGLFGQAISDELDCFVDVVNGTRRNGIEPSRLATDHNRSNRENADRRGDDENRSDQLVIKR